MGFADLVPCRERGDAIRGGEGTLGNGVEGAEVAWPGESEGVWEEGG